VRRWDGLVNLLQGVLGAIYFFHPAVWWANRRIRQLREDACDERTVAVLEGNRKPYGEAIFRVAEILGYSAPPLTLGVLDSTSPLSQRLRRILDPRLPINGVRHWQSALILIVGVAVLLPAGARPSASVADTKSERRIVAEAFSDSPLGSVKKNRRPEPRRELTPTGERAPTEEGTPEEPKALRPPEDSAMGRRATEDFVRDLSVPTRREAAIESLIAVGPSAEAELLSALAEASSTTRPAIYEVLASVGTEKSLLPLQQALLVRNTFEERQIRQALDAVYGRMEISVSRLEPSVNSSRIFEQDEKDEWDDGL